MNIITNQIADITTNELSNVITGKSTKIIEDKIKDTSYDKTTEKIIIYTTKDISKDITEDKTTTDIEKDLTTYIINNIETIKSYIKDNYINIASFYNTTNNTMIYNLISENLLLLFDPENDFEIISNTMDDVIYQITTSKNQLKALTNSSLNKYNLSILDIINCETILKEKYNLNKNDNLILLKKERKTSKASEKEVQVEIYEPYNKTKLNLSYCDATSINILVKAKLGDEIKYTYEKLKSL